MANELYALRLTDDERDELASMLRLAAEQYDQNAQLLSKIGQPLLSGTFSHQADRARTFAARIESE